MPEEPSKKRKTPQRRDPSKFHIKDVKKFQKDTVRDVKSLRKYTDSTKHNKPGFKKDFNRFLKNASENVHMPKKYKKLIDETNNSSIKTLLKVVPYIILSLSVLALKNIILIRTLIKAYRIHSEEHHDPENRNIKVFFDGIIKSFSKTLENTSNPEKILASVSAMNLITNEIPNLITGLDKVGDIPFFEMLKRIVENSISIGKTTK